MRSLTRIAAVLSIVAFLGVLFVDGAAFARGRGRGGRSRSRARVSRPSRSFSRSGPASRGSFSGRRTRPSTPRRTRPARTRPTKSRKQYAQKRYNRRNQRRKDRAAEGSSRRQKAQERINDRQEKRQEFIKDLQDDRQDFIEDMHDDHWDHHYHGYGSSFAAGVVVGSAATAATVVTTLPCSAKVVTVGGVTYYSCGSTWYQRSYAGSNITYVVVNPPSGY